jgi:hypothetical protein
MTTPLRLDDVRRAWEAQDPELVQYIEQIATQPEPKPDTPIHEGALTFAKFLREINSYQFRRKPIEEQQHYRIETLEAPDAEVPLSDRLRLHEIILTLWNDNGPFARRCLLHVIARVKLTYGPWRARVEREFVISRLQSARNNGGTRKALRLTAGQMVGWSDRDEPMGGERTDQPSAAFAVGWPCSDEPMGTARPTNHRRSLWPAPGTLPSPRGAARGFRRGPAGYGAAKSGSTSAGVSRTPAARVSPISPESACG